MQLVNNVLICKYELNIYFRKMDKMMSVLALKNERKKNIYTYTQVHSTEA